MCYANGHDTTMQLYRELSRVLRPGGRLITISLHREIEVLPYGIDNPACSFAASSCALAGTRKNDTCYSFCVFDKLDGCDAETAAVISSVHPIEFIDAVSWDSRGENEKESNGFIDELLVSFNYALEAI